MSDKRETAVDDASLVELLEALAQGHVTSTELTRAYLARIEAYDRQGPGLNAVRGPYRCPGHRHWASFARARLDSGTARGADRISKRAA